MRADAHPPRSGYYTLREHSARANSQERFRKEKKKQGRRKKRKERRRHYSTQFLASSSRTALVSRFYVNGPSLKTAWQSNTYKWTIFRVSRRRFYERRSRAKKKNRNTNRTRYKISPTFDYYTYERALCASFRTRDFYFPGVVINLS